MSRTATLTTIVLAFLAAFAYLSLFTVYETEGAILQRLGRLISQDDGNTPVVKGPGLHFKMPFVDTVKRFDTRINMLDINSSRIITLEKKHVLVDFFVQWRIDDLALFYTRTDGNKFRAESLLRQNVVDGLRAEFGRRTIREVVSGERAELMNHLRKIADKAAENKGIEVLDVRIKRIDLPEEVSESVYQRMRSERQRVASEYRAEGVKDANIIRANAEQKRRVLLAEAERDAMQIRGAGDATAVKIYADAYGSQPKFFEFYRSTEAYRKTFQNKGDVLLLKPDSEFFKFFRQKG